MGSINRLIKSLNYKSTICFLVAILLYSTEASLYKLPRFLILHPYSLVIPLWITDYHYLIELPRLIPSRKITIFFPSLDVIVVESVLKLLKLVPYEIA